MIRAVTNPTPADLDALEASRPRLVRQTAPGTYVVVAGPPRTPDPAWHCQQAELYQDAATREQSPKDREWLALLAKLHEGRSGQ